MMEGFPGGSIEEEKELIEDSSTVEDKQFSTEKKEYTTVEDLSEKYQLSPSDTLKFKRYIQNETTRDLHSANINAEKITEVIPPEILEDEIFQKYITQRIEESLFAREDRGIGYLHEFVEAYHIDPEYFKDSKFDTIRFNRIRRDLMEGRKFNMVTGYPPSSRDTSQEEEDINNIIFGSLYDFTSEAQKQELRPFAFTGIFGALEDGYVRNDQYSQDVIESYKAYFDITDDEIARGIIGQVKNGNDKLIQSKILENFPAVQVFLETQEGKSLIEEKLQKGILQGKSIEADIEKYGVTQEQIHTEKFQKEFADNLKRELMKYSEERDAQSILYFVDGVVSKGKGYISEEVIFDTIREVLNKFPSNNLGSMLYSLMDSAYMEQQYYHLWESIQFSQEKVYEVFESLVLKNVYSRREYLEKIFNSNVTKNLGIPQDVITRSLRGHYLDASLEGNEWMLDFYNKYLPEGISFNDSESLRMLKAKYIQLVGEGDSYTLNKMKKFFDQQGIDLPWNNEEFFECKAASKKGIVARFGERHFNIKEFINEYYPETHKVFLYANKELQEDLKNTIRRFASSKVYLGDYRHSLESIMLHAEMFGISEQDVVEILKETPMQFIGEQNIFSEVLRYENKKYSLIYEFVSHHNNSLENTHLEAGFQSYLEREDYESISNLFYKSRAVQELVHQEIKKQEDILKSGSASTSQISFAINFLVHFAEFSKSLSVVHPKFIVDIQNLTSELQRDYFIKFYKDEKFRDKLSSVTSIIGESRIEKNVWDIANKILVLNSEKWPAYVRIFENILSSPSQEIKRISDEIFDEVINAENPEEAYQRVESVFIHNNLPMVAKVGKIFDILHNDESIARGLNHKGSPILQNSTAAQRRQVLHNDLLSIHIESGNRSLKNYLNVFSRGEKLFEKGEQEGWNTLSYDELREATFVLKKLQTLKGYALGFRTDNALEEDIPINELYARLKADIGIKDGQSLSDRVSEVMLGGEFNSTQQALEAMQQSKYEATLRNTAFAEDIQNGMHIIAGSDLLKGVDDRYLENILQNGSVAKEFLGGGSDQDLTPLDTDVAMVIEEDLEKTFKDIVNDSPSSGYGSAIVLILKQRGQYHDTTNQEGITHQTGKFELFKTGVVDKNRHYGIRTGIPSAEIDGMIIKSENEAFISKVKFTIAKQAVYIPLVNLEGQVIFTYEEYQKLRKIFEGIDHFEGGHLTIHQIPPADSLYGGLNAIKISQQDIRREVELTSKTLESQIISVLQDVGVNFRDSFDNTILGSEFYDTGSTSRFTNLPDNYDFDFGIRLDLSNESRALKLAQLVADKLEGTVEIQDHGNGYYQLRAQAVTAINGVKLKKPVEVDVGFGKRSDEVVYASHDAVQDRLSSIEGRYGTEIKEEVVANIVLAKQILSSAKCYKKLDGGMGGIGVENWIIQSKGNIRDAFSSFLDVAIRKDGSVRPFDEFQRNYSIYDAGINIKFNNHDNFVYNLKEEGYKKMVEVIKSYSVEF